MQRSAIPASRVTAKRRQTNARRAAQSRARLPALGSALFTPAESFSTRNQLSAFPPFIRRTLRYAQSNVIDVANFGQGQQVFRANSLYDPDYTGTGHQPNGFDQLMVAYNHFTVLRATIRVRVLQTLQGGGLIEPGGIVLGWSDTGAFMSGQSDLTGCIEHRNVFATAFYGQAGGVGNQFILKGELDIAKLLRKTPQQLIEMANLRGTSAANPTEGYFFEIGLFSFSNNPGAITVLCDLEYDAVFSEPVVDSGAS